MMAESELHHHLKHRAVGWLLLRSCFTACTETDLIPGRGMLFDAGGCRRANGQRYLYGIEVKVSRADFAKEWRSTDKQRGKFVHYDRYPCGAEFFPHYCYVLCPQGLVASTEMPADWGLLHWINDQSPIISIKRARRNGNAPEWAYLPALELMAGQLAGRLREITREAKLRERESA